MSNVRRRMHGRNAALLEEILPRRIRGFGASNPSPHQLVRAARPTGGRRATAHHHQKPQQRADFRFTEQARKSGARECSSTEPSAKLRSIQDQQPGLVHSCKVHSVRPAVGSARWRLAASRAWPPVQIARLATHAPHPLSRLSPMSYPTPNPSIEGTSNIRLRLLSAAPHVKR